VGETLEGNTLCWLDRELERHSLAYFLFIFVLIAVLMSQILFVSCFPFLLFHLA